MRDWTCDARNDHRAAYLAAFHAVQAIIFDRTGKVCSRAWEFKAVADCDIGPTARTLIATVRHIPDTAA